MKKCIALMLTSIFIFGCSSSIFAQEDDFTSISEDWGEIVTSLSSDNYGGIYVEDDLLHIKPVSDKKTVEQLVESKTNRSSNSIIIDDVATYSVQELKNAAEKVWLKCEDLDILSVELRERENSIIVSAEEWTDERKESVLDEAQIQNVIFEETTVSDKSEGISKIAEQEMYSGEEFYVGDIIHNEKGNLDSTLGACVKMGSTKGYITTGHGNKVGDTFTIRGKKLGQITSASHVKYGGNLDVAFITQTTDSKFSLTNIVRLLTSDTWKTGGLNDAGLPVIEGQVVCYGSTSGRRWGTVQSISYTTRVNSSGPEFTNMVKMDSDAAGEDGDSGGPVMISLGNDQYRLVGIYKGIDYRGYPIATRWDSIANTLGVKLY